MGYISHPRIIPDKVEERRYQVAMAAECLSENTLVVLPTGLGKTVVALLVTAGVLEREKKVLLLAPTKPLVDQHSTFFSELLVNTKVGVMTGNMNPKTRAKTMDENDVVISTPQCVENDLDNSLYDLKKFGLVIYDEAHRGTGNYSYVAVARYCEDILSMGLTASPGSDRNKVHEVCNNLSLWKIEQKNDEAPDVAPYVHDTYIKRIEVNLPQEILDVVDPLKRLLDDYFQELNNLHLTQPNWPVSNTHMISIGASLQKRLGRGERSLTVYRGLTVQSICMKILHAIGLSETQGMTPLRLYMEKLNEEGNQVKGNKGGKELICREEYKTAWSIVSDTRTEHPKISKLMSLVSQILNADSSSKVIVFTQYRDTCDVLLGKLSGIEGARIGKLIGQSKGGLKQREQIDMLNSFRSGERNVIVATSVGEEGLDIASTNAVIFYEPVPSEIRTIQRRGRTGRKSDGEVFVLVAKGTMDEAFENSSRKKEELMRSELERLNHDLGEDKRRSSRKGQMDLGKFR
ncbi:MAG: DEAD/DEAH box helicase family protein [Candidatus Methanoplasma sp.]|jgi:Fanconi anemia group M protein|nr:DEAD/DEAH box helicase family protein [Candidatus Methanoplasma sp.]